MTARVLVVDDLLPNVKLLEAKLTKQYFVVITAGDGLEALARVKDSDPDIIMLDAKMPGMDGFEVCEKIKTNPETMHIPIIMVTALEDIQDRIRGLKRGADDFISKPVNDDILLARLRGLVRLKQNFDVWRMREKTALELGIRDVDHKFDENIPSRIVVVEHNNQVKEQIAKVLRVDSHINIVFKSLYDIQQTAFSEPLPDLFVINFDLSGGDGLRLCSHLRSSEKTRNIPIILMIDKENRDLFLHALEFGVNDYIPLPFYDEELQLRIKGQLRKKHYQDYLNHNIEMQMELAFKDSLTGLYNRRYYETHIGYLYQNAQKTEKSLALVIIDIDHFKHINDTYGHDKGDIVLQTIAKRLAASVRTSDFVARMGGEEFVLVMPNCGPEDALQVATRLHQAIISEPCILNNQQEFITVSMGLATTLDDVSNYEALYKLADTRLYQAKESGRNKICYIESQVA